MPFEKVDQSLLNTRPVNEPVTNRTVPTMDVIKGVVQDENVLFNASESLNSAFSFSPDPSYDPFDDMKGYEGYAEELQTSQSRDEMIHRKVGIDRKLENSQNFADSNMMQKFLGVGALVASDPTMLIPLGPAYATYRTGGKILEGGVKTAGIAAAIETGREAILRYNQDARTDQESLMNIGAATLVGGFLGGAAGAMSKANIDELASRFESEMVTPIEPRSGPTGLGMGSAGAAEVGLTTEDLGLYNLKRTAALFKKVPSFLSNPVFENATSVSGKVREINEKIADLSLAQNKNVRGLATEPSVELQVKMYDTMRVPFYKDYSANWKAYMQRAKQGLPEDQKIGSKTGGIMTRKEFDEQVGMANRRNDLHLIPEVQSTAQSVRKNVFAPVLKRAEEVGIFKDISTMDVKTADSWLKRVYNVDKIKANRIDFKARIVNWLKKERDIAEKGTVRSERFDEELADLAEDIIDRITNVTQGRIPYDTRVKGTGFTKEPSARGSAKSRVFAIPDQDIEDYLVSDIHAVVDSHLRTMAPDNELMAKFGTLDFDFVKKQIQEDYKALRMKIAADTKVDLPTKNKQLQKLDNAMEKDIKNTQAMWDKTRGTYAQPDDYSAPAHVFERGALALNFVRLLGDVVMSSLPDIGRNVTVHGIDRAFGDLFKSLALDMKGFKMAAGEAVEMGTAVDLMNSMTALRRANMHEYIPTSGKFDEFSKKGTAAVANLTGVNHWNAGMKTFSGIITQNRMLAAIDKLGKGDKIPQKEMINLASHGIGRKQAKIIAEQYAKYGEKRRVLRIANARNWDNAEARNLFRAAVRKQVDEIIVTPSLDRPLWLSRSGWRLLGQFKSFSFSSMQRVTMAGLQQGDANVVMGFALSAFIGSNVYAYKMLMAGKKPSDDPRVWITEGIDRSGIAGWFFDVNNMVEKATRGTVGVNALIGGPPMSRYASRNVVGALLGPTFGAAQSAIGVVGSAATMDWKESDTHAMRRLLPMQNIPYLKHLLDKVESSTNSAFGIRK